MSGSRKTAWIALAFLFSVGLGILAVVLVGQAQDRATQDMISRADRLRVPSSWAVLNERIQGERIWCIGDVPCPSLHRRWAVNAELGKTEFAEVIRSAGWDVTVEGDCLRRSNLGGPVGVCSAHAQDGVYNYLFSLESLRPGAPHELIFEVDPRN
jgi:hypothetical protein